MIINGALIIWLAWRLKTSPEWLQLVYFHPGITHRNAHSLKYVSRFVKTYNEYTFEQK